MGGEKTADLLTTHLQEGSPPRRRGKGSSGDTKRRGRGITPAWAGKRCWTSCSSAPSPDHPRVGGEKLAAYFETSAHAGSPPRGRGKAELSAAIDHVLGITPAYAGKSRPRRFWAHRSQDHPRVGGEKKIN